MDPVIRYEGTNHRGEPTSPRVDLLAVGLLLDRAAQVVRAHRRPPQSGRRGPRPRRLPGRGRPHLALRQIRSVRCRRKRRLRWTRERDRPPRDTPVGIGPARGITRPKHSAATALEAQGGLRHSDLAGTDGGRSGRPVELRRGWQHPSEPAGGIRASWRCRACGAVIGLDRATGTVRLDTSRPGTVRAPMR